jgi:hypothetical protein
MPKDITFEAIAVAVALDDNIGFCLACGEEAEGIEPDAYCVKCKSCGKDKVFGAEEILLFRMM